MVEVVRWNAPKFYKQRLFGFLTHHTSTSCTIKSSKVDGRYRSTLKVFGEDQTFTAVHDTIRDAEIVACTMYINRSVVNQEMTWGFLRSHNFLEMKARISTGLRLYGNYHPQVVVRELEGRYNRDLQWDIFPRGIADSYTCTLQIVINGHVYVAEETGNSMKEAKVATFMQMAKRLFDIGELPLYSTANIVVAMPQRPAGPQGMQQRPVGQQSNQQRHVGPPPLPAWLQPMPPLPAGPQAIQQRPAAPPNVQQQRQPGPGQQAMQQQSRNVIVNQHLQGMTQRPGQ